MWLWQLPGGTIKSAHTQVCSSLPALPVQHFHSDTNLFTHKYKHMNTTIQKHIVCTWPWPYRFLSLGWYKWFAMGDGSTNLQANRTQKCFQEAKNVREAAGIGAYAENARGERSLAEGMVYWVRDLLCFPFSEEISNVKILKYKVKKLK